MRYDTRKSIGTIIADPFYSIAKLVFGLNFKNYKLATGQQQSYRLIY
jgi:hypothetical protein